MTVFQQSALIWLAGALAGGVGFYLRGRQVGASRRSRVVGTIIGTISGAAIVGVVGDQVLERSLTKSPRQDVPVIGLMRSLARRS